MNTLLLVKFNRLCLMLIAAIAIWGSQPAKEESMCAAIHEGKAKAGMTEELTRRNKEGAIPIISDVPGFMAYYVVYAPDDAVTAISIFTDYAGAEESNRRAAVDRAESCTPAHWLSHSDGWASDRLLRYSSRQSFRGGATLGGENA